jgi:endonuclease/exonuclease/phosphatase (EEP) superfamily protein YafD
VLRLYLRLGVIGLVVAGWVPLLVVSGSRLTGGQATPMTQLASFAPLAGAGWLVALLVLLATRAWRLSLVAALLVVVHLVWLAPAVLQQFQAEPGPAGPPLRVLTINAQFGGADVAALIQLAASREVDLVAVQELTPQFAQAVTAGLGAQLPYSALYPAPGSSAGSGVWSRWPLTDEGLLTSPFRMPKVTVAVPGVGPVQVIGVHAMSPLPAQVTQWRADLAMLAGQADQARLARRPLIMLGDFNASRDHGPFRALADGPLLDAADAAVRTPWQGQTWPADRRWIPPSVRIDHVLVSRDDVAVSRVETTQIGGTDHRAVLAYLSLRSP